MTRAHARRGDDRVEADAVVAHADAVGGSAVLEHDRDVSRRAWRATFASSSLVQRSTARSFGPGAASARSSCSVEARRAPPRRGQLCPIAAASPACSSRYGCRSETAPRNSATVAVIASRARAPPGPSGAVLAARSRSWRAARRFWIAPSCRSCASCLRSRSSAVSASATSRWRCAESSRTALLATRQQQREAARARGRARRGMRPARARTRARRCSSGSGAGPPAADSATVEATATEAVASGRPRNATTTTGNRNAKRSCEKPPPELYVSATAKSDVGHGQPLPACRRRADSACDCERRERVERERRQTRRRSAPRGRRLSAT